MVDDAPTTEPDPAEDAEPVGEPEPTGEAEPEGEERPSMARRGVRLAVRAFVVLGALAVVYLGVTFVQVWRASSLDQSPPSEAIVVLGAAQYDGRPSPVLEARLQHALDLWEEGVAPLIVVTGGRQVGDRFTESTAGYNWLRQRGVPDEAILKEVQGRNTWESLRAVARFLEPRNVSDVVLVSDPPHSKRLQGIAAEVGLDAHVSPERSLSISGGTRARAMVRETAAVSVGRIIGYGRLTRLTS